MVEVAPAQKTGSQLGKRWKGKENPFRFLHGLHRLLQAATKINIPICVQRQPHHQSSGSIWSCAAMA